jgi:hypothetical protein
MAGDLAFLCGYVEDNLRKMEKLQWRLIQTKEQQLESNMVAKYRLFCEESHAFLHFMRYAIFGGFSRHITTSRSDIVENGVKECTICNKKNCTLRCSRCKCVYYCSKAHQSEDWKTHKVSFCKLDTNMVITFGILQIVCEVMDESLTSQSMDTDDPEEILLSDKSPMVKKDGTLYTLIMPTYLRIIRNFLSACGIIKSASEKSSAHQNITLIYPILAIFTAQVIESIGDIPLFTSEFEFKKFLSQSVSSFEFIISP